MRGLGKLVWGLVLMACVWAIAAHAPNTAKAQDATPTATIVTAVTVAATPPITKTTRPTPQPIPAPVYLGRITAIGDSVMLGAIRDLRRTIIGIDVDAGKSRQMREAVRILNARQTASQLGDVVVVHVGNNGPIDAKLFDELMQPLRDAQLVVIVNLKVGRPWETKNNLVLADGVSRYPNATLFDWHGAIETNTNLLAADGTHMGAKSAVLYVRMLVQKLSTWKALQPMPMSTAIPWPVEFGQ